MDDRVCIGDGCRGGWSRADDGVIDDGCCSANLRAWLGGPPNLQGHGRNGISPG